MAFQSNRKRRNQFAQTHFGNLRSILQRDPSHHNWTALCQAIDHCQQPLNDALLYYISGHLKHWPDLFKTVPYRWLDTLKSYTQPQPALKLARTFDLSLTNTTTLREGAENDTETTRRLFQHPFMANLTHVHLGVYLFHINDLNHLPNLKSLSGIWSCAYDITALHRLLEGKTPFTLERLNLSNTYVRWYTLAKTPQLNALTHFRMRQHRALEDEWALIPDAVQFESVRELDFGYGTMPSQQSIKDLFDSPMVNNLHALYLPGTGVDDTWTASMCETSSDLSQLHTLDLSHATWKNTHLVNILESWSTQPKHLTLRGIQGHNALLNLGQSSCLSKLRYLDLTQAQYKSSLLTDILSSPHLSNLQTLMLFSSEQAQASLHRIDRSSFAAQLHTLDIGGKTCTDTRALEVALACPNLRTLGLRHNGLGVDAAKTIAKANAQHLNVLNLADNNLTAEGAKALAQSRHLQQLEELNLGGAYVRNDIGDEGLSALVKAPFFHNLRRLNLSHNLITRKGIQVLVDPDHGSAIHTLDLSCNPLDDLAIIELMESSTLRAVRHLILDQCNLSYRGLLAILESPHLSNLSTLSIQHNELSLDAIRLLLEENERIKHLNQFYYRDNTLSRTMDTELRKLYHMPLHFDANRRQWSCQTTSGEQLFDMLL